VFTVDAFLSTVPAAPALGKGRPGAHHTKPTLRYRSTLSLVTTAE
jgi:hypothetical protein